MKQGILLAALLVVISTPIRAESQEGESNRAAVSSVPSEEMSPSESKERAHPDCMKSCLEEDEFLFDCTSYCILTV